MQILVVEDDALQRMMMSEMLRDRGHDVTEADNGDAAIALILNPLMFYTALVTDFNMPGITNGGDVAECFRSRWPWMPVIIATGRPDILKPSWSNDSMYECLKKPFALGSLVLLVEAMLSRATQVPDVTRSGCD